MRPIDADALIDFIDCGHLRNPLQSCFSERDVVDMLESRPTIEPTVVHGKWVIIDDGVLIGNGKHVECSNCGAWSGQSEKPPYCKHCGAAMTEDKPCT